MTSDQAVPFQTRHWRRPAGSGYHPGGTDAGGIFTKLFLHREGNVQPIWPEDRGAQGAEKFDPHTLDGVVARLREYVAQWATVLAKERVELVDRMIYDKHSIAPLRNEAACRAKGLDPKATQRVRNFQQASGCSSTCCTPIVNLLLMSRVRAPCGSLVRHSSESRVARPGVSCRFCPVSAHRVAHPANRVDIWMAPGIDEDAIRAPHRPERTQNPGVDWG